VTSRPPVRPASAAVALTLAVAALTLLTSPVAAEPGPPSHDGHEATAMALLEKASDAARRHAYRGTQFVATWGRSGSTQTLVADVAHVPGRGTAISVERTPGGPGGSVFASAGAPVVGLAGPTARTLPLLGRNYDAVVAGTGRVAGRDARVVEALRRDGSVAARFWLDRRTGLLLRRQVLDERGRTVRASAYVDVTVGEDDVALTHLPPVLPEPWTREVDDDTLVRMRRDGWSCPHGLPERLTLYDARTQPPDASGQDGSGPVLHLSYSDGLSTVSLFQQRGHLDAPPAGFEPVAVGEATVYVREGVPRRVVWSAQGRVYTVFAEAPWRQVEAVVAALPHEEEDDGALDRVGRGLGRVVSWLNPFD
jgi:sigma-E factor negative regulatory protein RseB